MIFGTIVPRFFSPPILHITQRNLDFALQWATEAFAQFVHV